MVTIRVTMPDGSEWDVPGDAVAAHRAAYYAGKETDEDEFRRVLHEEYKFALANEDELLDWAANNMDWSDVEKEAKRVVVPPPLTLTPKDFQEGWVNGPKKVIRE